MIPVLLLTLALELGGAPAAPPAGCDAACTKVTDATVKRWPQKRKATPEQQKAFEKAKADVHARCLADCERLGDPFVRCVKHARGIHRLEQCYFLRKKR